MIKKITEAIAEIVSRLVIAFVFINSGWGKFHSLDKVVSYFESLNIPYAHLQAPFVAGVELLAGLMILIGFKTKWASVPLIGIMLVAIKTAKWEDVTDISSLLDMSEFLYIVILLWLFAQGVKYLSLDSLKVRVFKS